MHGVVLSIGNLNLDVTLTISKLPEVDEHVEPEEVYVSGGGSASNFALAISRLGLKSRLLCCVGNDILSTYLIHELESEGVDVKCTRRGSSPGIAIILKSLDGLKRMIIHRGSNLMLQINDLTENTLKDVKHAHVAVSRVEIIRAMLERLKSRDVCTSIDLNVIPEKYINYIHHLQDLNIIFMNYARYRLIFKVEDFEKVKDKISAEEIVITMGSKGALVIKDRIYRANAFKVKAIDTTGAGDTFAAGYIVGKLLNLDIEDRLIFASACAALKVTKLGARSSPRLSEVLNFLEKNGLSDLADKITKSLPK